MATGSEFVLYKLAVACAQTMGKNSYSEPCPALGIFQCSASNLYSRCYIFSG